MDYLKDAAKNFSLYDAKAYVRKAQNGTSNHNLNIEKIKHTSKDFY